MKIEKIVRRLALLCLVMPLAAAQGATLYVSTQGSDSNPGTSAQPFRTITRAYGLAGPGTTILVLPGTYTDYTSGWGLHLGASGTASSPIVLQSQVRGGAIIDGQNAADRNEGFYIDGSYNVVQGFEIRNNPNGGVTIWGNGNQIIDNEIHNNGNPASTSTNGKDGVYSDQSTSGTVYAGNYVHDNGRPGSNLDHGFYLCGKNELVVNNVLLRNAACGLQIAGYTTVSGLQVYNNVMAWNGTDGIILWQALNGVTIKNNLLYANGHYGVGSYAATGGGVVVDHNLAFGNGSGAYDFAGGGSTYSYTLGTAPASDPLFVNETSAGFDAHLGTGSPAIGAGVNLSSVFTVDLAGAARPASGAWDLGAHAYLQTPGDTTPPTISLTAPTSGKVVSGVITVSASASDNVGVAGVQFTMDGANLGSVFTAAPYAGTLDTSGVSNGLHTLGATAWDAAGNHATATPVTVTVSNAVSSPGLPTVTVAATVPTAVIGTTNYAVFTFARTGSTSGSLTVNYTLGGTAVKWTDYRRPVEGDMPVSIVIPAGASTCALSIAGEADSTGANPETASVTLSSDPGYTVGTPASASITIVSNTASTLPTVSVSATTPNASRVWLNAGQFTLTRSGSTAAALTVNYALGGTAANGNDYRALGTSVTIPAGAAAATVTVSPLSSTSYVGAETAVLALSATSTYGLGSPNNATVNIAGNSVPSKVGNAPGNNMKITWSSVTGKAYRVACKNSMGDTTWTNLSGLITASGSTTSYTDTTANQAATRYYVVYVTD